VGLLQPDVGHGRGHGETHLSPAGRAITVISPAQAAAALAAAAAAGQPVFLLSAPDAAASVGPAWFAALVNRAASRFPKAEGTPLLDCGDAAGYALAALRLGLKAICYDGAAAARVRDIADQYGAVVLAERPPSLDLETIEASGGDMAAACTAWLAVKT
jgi:hypothetical protein